MAESIEKLPAVLARTSLSRSNLLARVKEGKFPAPIKLSARSVGWISSEVDAWIKSRIREARAA